MDAAGGHGSSATAGNRPAPRSRASVSIIDTHVHDTSIRARRVHARSGLADGSLALTSTHAAAGDAFRGSYTLARNTFLAPGGGERGQAQTVGGRLLGRLDAGRGVRHHCDRKRLLACAAEQRQARQGDI